MGLIGRPSPFGAEYLGFAAMLLTLSDALTSGGLIRVAAATCAILAVFLRRRC